MSRSVSFLIPMAVFVVLCSTQTAQADLVGCWNFNTLVPNTNNGTTYAPDIGDGMLTLVGFTADGISSKAGSTINTISPDLAGQNLTLTGKANNGAMLIYALDLSGAVDPILTFADRRTGSGFNSIQVSYSTDGTNYFDFGSAYTPTTNYELRTIDLSSVNVLDGAATAFVKFTLDGASNRGGQYRLDNVQFNSASSATSAPEPSLMAAGGAIVAVIIGMGVRRKRIAKIVTE